MPATPRRLAASAGGAEATSSARSTVVERMSFSISTVSPAMSKFMTSPP